MKSTTAATILALTAAATSSPLFKRQNTCRLDTVANPSSTDIFNAIQQWTADVISVNDFLNSVSTITDPNDLFTATQNALSFAQDEPCQFGTLRNNIDAQGAVVAKFGCSVSDLDSIFKPHVLDNLNIILADPSDTTAVQNAVDDININRCCGVLPDVDTLFLDSAVDSGISDQVPLSVPRPDACAAIECTPVCDGLDNGGSK